MKDKVFIELIAVLILVGFGLWLLKKDSAPVVNENPVNSQKVAPN